MKRIAYILILLAIVLVGCESKKSTTEIGTRDYLIGRWQGVSPYASKSSIYFVFYDEVAQDGYYWGKTWDTYDSSEDQLVYHGNGWFLWKKGPDYIRQVDAMEISTGMSAHDQEIYELTDTKLVMSDAGKRLTLTKIGKE